MDQLEMYFALYHLRQCIFDKGTLLPQPLQSINQTCSIQLTMSLITMKSLIKQYRSITKILVFIGRNHTCVYKIYIPIQCRKITDVFVEKLKIKETLITCQATPTRRAFLVLPFSLHFEKFKMNEEVDSLLSEKVSNLLLT